MSISYQGNVYNYFSGNFLIDPSKNFGDVISKSIIEFFSNKKLINEHMFQFDYERKIVFRNGKLISIGSSFIFSRSNDYIWGTGCINSTSLGDAPRKIYAVRGPLTRDVLLKNNIDCPEIYGDPAVLYPQIYHPKVEKTHKYGIIPHYIDFTDETILKKLESLESLGVKIINITDDEETFIDNLSSVEFVLSSSLHGIIMSDAYGIPNVKIVLSNKLVGGSFKFRDYFMSVNRPYSEHELPEDFSDFDISKLPYDLGNVEPLKENLLIHNPWNDPTFPYFEKSEKSFVYYCTENYLPIVETSIKSLRKHSSLPIIVYTLNFEHNFNQKNVISYKWECDIESLEQNNFVQENNNFYIKREEHKFYKILIQRPLIIQHSLENFSNVVCYVDSDSIATPWVDNIFDYFPVDSEFPYLTSGIYDYFSLNGRGLSNPFDWEKTLEHETCKLLGVNQKVRQNYRQTGYIVAGQNTKTFLGEWYSTCTTPEILDNPSWYAPYHEETIINVLFWKKDFHNSLPLCYVNGSLKDLNEIFDNKNYTGQKRNIRQWFRLPEKKEYVHFIHGEKNTDVMKDMINRIENLNMKKLKVLFLAPHLSTGGMPGFLLKRIESLFPHDNRLEIFVVEYTNLSGDYVVQKNQIKKLISKTNFFTLGQNKLELIDIIKNNNIDIVHIDDVIESLAIYKETPKELMNALYDNERTWRIIETCHNVSFNPEVSKHFIPDAFAYCTPWHPEVQFKSVDTQNDVIEFPIENKKVSKEEKINYQKILGLDTTKVHVMNVGLWTRGKNQGEGIEIARLLEKSHPEIIFHFIGNQAPNFKNYWGPLMNNLPSNVKVWGERHDADNFIKACDIFLFNSTWECNPLVLREAISFGKVVLSRNLTEYMDMFEKYIIPIDNDIESTSQKIISLIGVEPSFSLPSNSFEEFGNQHLELYDKVHQSNVITNEKYQKKTRIVQNFITSPYLEVHGPEDSLFNVQFYDDKGVCHFNSDLKSGNWVRLNRQYFTNWRTKVWQDGKVIRDSFLDLKDKRVYIAFDSKSLGDNVAWIPYVLEFQKKHNCRVIVSTFWNHLFENVYPELEFIKPGQICPNIFAQYKIGWFFNENLEPEIPNTIPLQKAATNILGLEYKEIKPRIDYHVGDRPVEQKYVTIATNSTSGLKFWTKKGWQEVINYLTSQGYLVFNVSKEKNPFNNAIQIKDTSIENTMRVIHHSEFFIGLSSGLSWLSWGMGKKVVMISNFTTPDHEFVSDCVRITNPKSCHGCWNKKEFKFDRGDWNWCPIHKGTDRQFECHTSIESEMVIDKIQKTFFNKKIYITFSYGYKNNELTKVLKKSINEFSKHELKIYTSEDFSFNYEYNNPEFWKSGFGFIMKIHSCLKSLEIYDEVVWLDTDIVVTEKIDEIWNYTSELENYPLLPKYRFSNFKNFPSYPSNDENTQHTKDLCEYFEVENYNSKKLTYLQGCCMIFDKNSKNFFKKVLEYFDDYNSKNFPCGDESIINGILWKNKFEKNLGNVFLCSQYFHSNLSKYINLQNKENYSKVLGLGLVENNFDKILFFHGAKSLIVSQKLLNLQIIEKNKNKKSLGEILRNYGSDKSTKHNYSELYSTIFDKFLDKEINIFELGIGSIDTSIPWNMTSNGKPGASLFSWSEYFPKSNIFAADIDKKVIFNQDRIHCFECDQLDTNSIEKLWSSEDLKNIEFDIMILDGVHTFDANIFFLNNSFHKIKKGGVCVIEDIDDNEVTLFKNYIPEIEYWFPNFKVSFLKLFKPNEDIRDNNIMLLYKK